MTLTAQIAREQRMAAEGARRVRKSVEKDMARGAAAETPAGVQLMKHLKWMGEDTVIYTFRHTCASRLTIAGVDLNRIKVWMGHKTIITTLKYAHLAPNSIDAGTDALEAFQTQHRQAA